MSNVPEQEEDEFTREAEAWIRHNAQTYKERHLHGDPYQFDALIDLIVFNVHDRYYDLVKYPEQCPGCSRSGRTHDGECPTAYPELYE
jgi:hypothetical protein